MKTPASILTICSLLLFSACTKETQETIENEINPTISDVPEIELLGINQQEVVEYQDSLVFTVSYLDGDGDLGSPDPDKTSIELIDQRAPGSLIFMYHLAPRGPADAGVPLSGELNIVLNNTIILEDGNDSETTTFSIRIVDEAGNWSNQVDSPEVTIVKE